jgi:hypothetical protein
MQNYRSPAPVREKRVRCECRLTKREWFGILAAPVFAVLANFTTFLLYRAWASLIVALAMTTATTWLGWIAWRLNRVHVED